MLRRIRLALLTVLLLCSAAPARAGKADDPLASLAWLADSKWVAQVKAPDGKPLTVESTFEWSAHRKALRFTIVFKSEAATTPQYEGLYWWDPAAKEIQMLQIDRQGNVTKSTASAEGNTLRQKNQLTRFDGTKQEQRVEVAREGDDAFTLKAFVPRRKEWVEAANFTYRRVREEKAR